MSTLTIALIVVVSILGALALLVGYACLRMAAVLDRLDEEHAAAWHVIETEETRR